MPILNKLVIFDEQNINDSLKKALSIEPKDVVMEVRESGLKGRGGAGFPTGTKWMLASSANSKQKYVVCNADEGEPGTFKDRVLLDEYTKLVFEGMVIGGYAIGANKGFLYLRGEYRYLLDKLNSYLEQMRKENRLGNNILGTNFSFDIEIRLGSGAYVCGEESALIESLEGHRGEARNRPPFPVNTGYLGSPTIVNNVETFASVHIIIAKGAEWYSKHGTSKSTGTKLLSISGDCKKPGVYEVPFGITINEILKLVEAENTKAVQVGGASGTCIPKAEFERSISFEDISTGGSVIIFNETRSMLHILENFMEFFVEESCGQCTPCRIGNVKLLDGLKKIRKGECSLSYIHELIELGKSMQIASKCGLGQSSPNPFISIMTHFENEIFSQR
ncbi:MAG TPA: NADH-ubiquinone oxidoreductase-F iron-sulfur binding region domain-containing protein [Candidatus Kapabacteria bacterium]|nr:NADH-ubiquinone oxidoreductase-F iron-sulfur binding region domain-containing protein [Candidatus Kapabacteria bacterium]HPO61489.1 NADH-ubiquinone oxidoreductase-F iron-sulfur binding region domain-containing protein [Candidatus Kapabacteria bacterium]